jgi:predicted regulator of Ras-like GTPase activity (Roadblock/LC7/MglB family)
MRDESPEGAVSTDQTSLGQVLGEMNDEGLFRAVVLVTGEGLPLSSVSSPFDTETIAAMVALVKNTILQAREEIGLDEVDEVSVVQGDKMRLVCRYFVIGEEELILAVIVPPRRTYRRLTSRAIGKIKAGWEGFSWARL